MMSFKKIRITTIALAAVLIAIGSNASATTISSNLSNATAGTEAASGSTWLTASFGTGTSSATLASVTLLLSNPTAGVAEVDLYSDGLLEPASLVGKLTSPGSYTSILSATTFSAAGFTVTANSTYWIVLKALSGEFDWGWTSDNTGTGSGFQGTWGISTDAGGTWYTYNVYPTQFSVETTAAAIVPEPSSLLLIPTTLLFCPLVHFVGRRFPILFRGQK